MGTFSAKISQFIDKTNKSADLVMRKVTIDLTQRVKMKTPVDTGALRASWTASLGAQPTTFNGSESVNMNAKFGDTWYLATDKPYAPMLEYGLYPAPGSDKTVDGYSIQAPKGMVRISVKETLNWLKRVKL